MLASAITLRVSHSCGMRVRTSEMQERFDKQILNKVESLLPETAERVWIVGNHDFWSYQLVEEHPEFKGLERETALHLKDRGWKVVPCGSHYRLGKLTVIHGDQLANAGYVTSNHSKKALEIYGQNVLYHHMHAPASATKIMPFDQQEKYMAWCAPAGCTKNPHYLRNRPTAWLNGFTIIEVCEQGLFNLYPVIVSRGQFVFGGRIYKG
jgi:hypothetical protein